jgi:hypothetical protein
MSTSFVEANDIASLILTQHTSQAWGLFLRIWAQNEQSQQRLPSSLQRMGHAFAVAHPLPSCQTLSDLQAAMNHIWSGMQWGQVQLSDEGVHLSAKHTACPLAHALAIEPEVAALFLQAAYIEWLGKAGAPPNLALQLTSASSNGLVLSFQLAEREGGAHV